MAVGLVMVLVRAHGDAVVVVVMVVLLACWVMANVDLRAGVGVVPDDAGVGPSAVGGGRDVGTANCHLGKTSAVCVVCGA
jgi:hypothetical protein